MTKSTRNPTSNAATTRVERLSLHRGAAGRPIYFEPFFALRSTTRWFCEPGFKTISV